MSAIKFVVKSVVFSAIFIGVGWGMNIIRDSIRECNSTPAE